jgi:Tfp pilus assembly protein PilW
MLKGTIGLIVIVAIIWVFWMTKEWLTKDKPKKDE